MNIFQTWARRRPWDNWIFAGLYVTTFMQAVTGLIAPPQNILATAGQWLTILWCVTTIVSGVVGFVGAVGPTVTLPAVSVRHKRLRLRMVRVVAPNYRMEMTACVIGWLGVLLYASSLWITTLVTNSPDRASAAFGVTSHFLPLLFRWVWFHLRERAEIANRVRIAKLVGDNREPGHV